MIIYKITVLTVVKSKSKNRPHPLLFFVSAGGYTKKVFYFNNNIKTRKQEKRQGKGKTRKLGNKQQMKCIISSLNTVFDSR